MMAGLPMYVAKYQDEVEVYKVGLPNHPIGKLKTNQSPIGKLLTNQSAYQKASDRSYRSKLAAVVGITTSSGD